jgi:hypothetical protein
MVILTTATELMFTTRVVLARHLPMSSCIQFHESLYEVTNGRGFSSGILFLIYKETLKLTFHPPCVWGQNQVVTQHQKLIIPSKIQMTL